MISPSSLPPVDGSPSLGVPVAAVGKFIYSVPAERTKRGWVDQARYQVCPLDLGPQEGLGRAGRKRSSGADRGSGLKTPCRATRFGL